MNIIVCLKQTPDITKAGFDVATGTLQRQGVENIMNPFDRQALEVALTLKDKEGGKVTAISMGLPQATDILKEAISMGADDAVLLQDAALEGSDSLGTSLALAAAIKKLGAYDIILCGKQAVDGGTAQVGPQIAELLGIPQLTGALKLEFADGKFLVERENESMATTLACAAPVLVTVSKSAKEPRFASIKGKMKARKAQIPTWGIADLGLKAEEVGLLGSPTRIRQAVKPVAPEIHTEIIQEDDAAKAAELLLEKLIAAKLVQR